MIHPKVCVQIIDQCKDRIQRYQSERRHSMKKMKLIKSRKMLTVMLTATAAMAVTATTLSGNCGAGKELFLKMCNGSWKRMEQINLEKIRIN